MYGIYTILVCCGEERAEMEGEAFNILISQFTSPFPCVVRLSRLCIHISIYQIVLILYVSSALVIGLQPFFFFFFFCYFCTSALLKQILWGFDITREC